MSDDAARHRILIADDEITNREMLYRLLKDYGEIIEAANGRHALDLVQIEHFDLVILDALMPGLTGIEVYKMLRAMPETSSLPVIFLSELTEDSAHLYGMQIDPADYLLLPIDIDYLQARVEVHLGLCAAE